jgi:hypothetical protein
MIMTLLSGALQIMRGMEAGMLTTGIIRTAKTAVPEKRDEVGRFLSYQ